MTSEIVILVGTAAMLGFVIFLCGLGMAVFGL